MAISVTARGTNTQNASAASYSIAPSGNFAAGSRAWVAFTYDNSGTNGADPFSSISDTKGNTYISSRSALLDPGAANAGTVTRIYYTEQDVGTLTTGDSITMNFSPNIVAGVVTLWEIVPTSGYTLVHVIPQVTTGTNSTLTAASVVQAGHLVIGIFGREYNGTRTGDSDTLDGSWSTAQSVGIGTTTSGQEQISQYKVVTADGSNQSFGPTMQAVSTDGACFICPFYEYKYVAKDARSSTSMSATAAVYTLSSGQVLMDAKLSGSFSASASIMDTGLSATFQGSESATAAIGLRIDESSIINSAFSATIALGVVSSGGGGLTRTYPKLNRNYPGVSSRRFPL
jgi:hypothetical protein